MKSLTAVTFGTLVALSTAHPHEHARSVGHSVSKRLPDTWYHREDHPVHNLFKRDDSTDGTTYAAVGSDAWTSSFQYDIPPQNQLPQAWFDALNAAVQAGKIPNIPPSTQPQGPGTNPVYAQGFDPNSPNTCSQTYQCKGQGVIFDAPQGYFASSFDDGPLPSTEQLVDFLSAQGVKTTHFMIGRNILNNPTMFLKAFNAGHDIAVHTWTHPYMTTLTNEQVVAELGLTMEIIRNSTGGRVPRYWRPPSGDADNRVNAIANEVFALTTVKWNQDSEDWRISEGGNTVAFAESNLTSWINGPQNPGLIALEHELDNNTVGVFMNIYPLIAQKGWKWAPVTQLFNDNTPYKNADASQTGTVTPLDVVGAVQNLSPAASSAPAGSNPSQSAGGAGSSKSGVSTASPSGSSGAAPASGSGGAAPGSASSLMNNNKLTLTLCLVAVSLFSYLL